MPCPHVYGWQQASNTIAYRILTSYASMHSGAKNATSGMRDSWLSTKTIWGATCIDVGRSVDRDFGFEDKRMGGRGGGKRQG